MAEPIIKEKHIPTGNKSIRSPEQLLVLAKAREKAIQVRKFNAVVKKAEKDIILIDKLNVKKGIIAKHKELLDPETLPVPVPVPVPVAIEPSEPSVAVNLIEPKVKTKKIKVVEQSDSDEEEIVYIKKAKKPVKPKKIVYISDDDEPEPAPPPPRPLPKKVFKNQLTSF